MQDTETRPPAESRIAMSTQVMTGKHSHDEVQCLVTDKLRARIRRQPSRPLLRTAFRSFSGAATVLVGNESGSRGPVKYLVHKELLTAASPFFAAALGGTFAEGLDQSVRLPEEKPEIFEWFLQWLYSGSLTTQDCDTSWIPNGGVSLVKQHSMGYLQWPQARDMEIRMDGELRNPAGSPKYFLLIDLYGLSDRLLTTELSNHILSTIARLSESTNSVPTPSDTRILYEQIRDTAPLKTLILDLFAFKKTDKLLATHKDEWHARFLRDLVVKLKRPGPEAIERHSLGAWRPRSWNSTKACDSCRELLKPDVSHERCYVCERAFCMACVRGEADRRSVLGEDTGGCKPWMGSGLCRRYHEHAEGEECDITRAV